MSRAGAVFEGEEDEEDEEEEDEGAYELLRGKAVDKAPMISTGSDVSDVSVASGTAALGLAKAPSSGAVFAGEGEEDEDDDGDDAAYKLLHGKVSEPGSTTVDGSASNVVQLEASTLADPGGARTPTAISSVSAPVCEHVAHAAVPSTTGESVGNGYIGGSIEASVGVSESVIIGGSIEASVGVRDSGIKDASEDATASGLSDVSNSILDTMLPAVRATEQRMAELNRSQMSLMSALGRQGDELNKFPGLDHIHRIMAAVPLYQVGPMPTSE